MRILLLLSLLVLSYSSWSQKVKGTSKSQSQLLKEYALCKCLDMGFKEDSLLYKDYSTTVIVEQVKLDYEIFDEIQRHVNSYVSKIKVSAYQDTRGKRGILINCIDYYESKELDRLVKSLNDRFRK